MKIRFLILFCIILSLKLTAQVVFKTDAKTTGKVISQNLIGAFFEDINFAADGGLYAELVQNRSFEYYPVTDSLDNNMVYCTTQPLDAWTLVKKGSALATMAIEKNGPLNANNPSYLKLNITYAGTEAGVSNSGFFGIPVVSGGKYNFSVYLRSVDSFTQPLIVRIESSTGVVLGSDTIKNIGTAWTKYERTITCKTTDATAKLVLATKGTGSLYLDMVSLFPTNTFKNRPNGLRADLAQVVADMKPRFLRFPGGCITHGRGIENMYLWKNSIGNVEQRKPNWNMWGYHQTLGLGFYEYFQFCEDIGAMPFPVLPAGVSCQFRRREIVPIADMQPYIQDAIDLVEFANGDVTTTWGKIRSDMGHPAPFNMEYILLGNEEDDIPEFRVRFKMMADSLKKYHPEIKVIGTSGTAAGGGNYDGLWQFSKEEKIAAVDEHYYVSPTWLLNNPHRYDNFDRKGPKVFIGEWASGDDRLANAVAEAAYLTNVERNGDVIDFTCYAPLLVNDSRGGWRPDLIRFDRSRIAKTPNYYVQQLFSTYSGQKYIENNLSYTDAYQPTPVFPGKVGVGSWSTQAKFKDLKVISGDSTLMTETFTSGTANWSVLAGTFTTSADTYVQSSALTPAWSVHSKVINKARYTYTLKAMKTGGAEGFIIPFGFVDDKNYSWVNIGGWWNTQHAIETSVNGAKSAVVTTAGSIVNNTWYDIKIDVNMGAVKVYLNNQLIMQILGSDGPVSASVVKDTINNKLIVKMINAKELAMSAKMSLKGVLANSTGEKILLTASNPTTQNLLDTPNLITPVKSTYTLTGDSLECQLPAYSVQVFVFDIDNSPSGLRNLFRRVAKGGIKIVPNPVTNISNVYFENKNAEACTMSLVNTNGQTVTALSGIKTDYFQLNRKDFPKGLYFLSIEGKTIHLAEKMVIN